MGGFNCSFKIKFVSFDFVHVPKSLDRLPEAQEILNTFLRVYSIFPRLIENAAIIHSHDQHPLINSCQQQLLFRKAVLGKSLNF